MVDLGGVDALDAGHESSSEPQTRICMRCHQPFVIGSKRVCALCREKVKARHQERSHAPVKSARQGLAHENVMDIDHAIRELQTARAELAAVPAYATRQERQHALVEPLARLGLVRRFVDGVLERGGVR